MRRLALAPTFLLLTAAASAQLPPPPSGWDACLWADPAHKTPKYQVGMVIVNYAATPAGLQQAAAVLGNVYPGTTLLATGDGVHIPCIGNATLLAPGGGAWQWSFDKASSECDSPTCVPRLCYGSTSVKCAADANDSPGGDGVDPGCPLDLVQSIRDKVRPVDTASAFEVSKRVAWTLGAGLLLKPGGENVVTWKGQSFSAGRFCWPNTGHLWKVVSSVGACGTNGAACEDEGIYDDKTQCEQAMNPGPLPPPRPRPVVYCPAPVPTSAGGGGGGGGGSSTPSRAPGPGSSTPTPAAPGLAGDTDPGDGSPTPPAADPNAASSTDSDNPAPSGSEPPSTSSGPVIGGGTNEPATLPGPGDPPSGDH